MHSYVIYAGFSKKAAVKAGLDEKDWRGGKYDHEVLEFAPGDQNKKRRKTAERRPKSLKKIEVAIPKKETSRKREFFWASVKKNLSEKFKNIAYATDFYRATANMRWKYKGANEEYSYTWRYAGGMVADIRDMDDDYCDFYRSGREGQVSEEIKNDLEKLGWIQIREENK